MTTDTYLTPELRREIVKDLESAWDALDRAHKKVAHYERSDGEGWEVAGEIEEAKSYVIGVLDDYQADPEE